MIKVSLIVLGGLTAASLLRSRSAALRHWVLAAAILCAGTVPLLEQIVPSWRVPLHPSLFGRTVEPFTLVIPVHATQALEDLQAGETRSSGFGRRFTAQRILAWSWLIGALCNVSMLMIGLARLAMSTRRSTAIAGGPWIDVAARLSRAYGLRGRVILLQSAHPTLLVTWGIRQPKIILPRSAHDWPDDRMRIVLGHELAHIRRGDWLTQMAAELLRCAYWFNPLAWIACRRLRLESEHACDDAVLGLGIHGPEYATHLLTLVRTFKQSGTTMFPAPAMARPSSFERRIRAMLNTHLDRTPITFRTGVTVAAVLAALTIPLAGLTASVQSSTASFSGVLVDAVGHILPDTTLILTDAHSAEKHEVSSDATGHFLFGGLPAGDYSLEARRLGFATAQGRVTLEAGQNLVRDVALQVGGLHETIRITGSSASASAASAAARPRAINMRNQPGLDSCTPPAVGGEIIPPTKLTDQRPLYPPKQQAAGIGALVEIDGRIGIDGLVKDFRLTAPADQDFVNALIDAVRQWQFTQTKLDCVPVEVNMHISARFSVE